MRGLIGVGRPLRLVHHALAKRAHAGELGAQFGVQLVDGIGERRRLRRCRVLLPSTSPCKGEVAAKAGGWGSSSAVSTPSLTGSDFAPAPLRQRLGAPLQLHRRRQPARRRGKFHPALALGQPPDRRLVDAEVARDFRRRLRRLLVAAAAIGQHLGRKGDTQRRRRAGDGAAALARGGGRFCGRRFAGDARALRARFWRAGARVDARTVVRLAFAMAKLRVLGSGKAAGRRRKGAGPEPAATLAGQRHAVKDFIPL